MWGGEVEVRGGSKKRVTRGGERREGRWTDEGGRGAVVQGRAARRGRGLTEGRVLQIAI